MKLKPQALVLDDDPFFRKTLEVVIAGLGMNVKTTASFAEFRRELATINADILLVDIQVGEENGLLLVEELRAQGITTPVVVISGKQDAALIAHALEIGANDYILKPFDKMLFGAKLLQFVNTQELEDQGKLLHTLDGKGVAAKILFGAQVIEVDELGVRFVSPHLIPKGAAVKLRGDFVRALGCEAEECLVSVTQTQLNAAEGIYEIYAEFEGVDVAFLQAVRRWITSRKQTLAA